MLRYKTETRPGLVALYDIRPLPENGAGQSRYSPDWYMHLTETLLAIGGTVIALSLTITLTFTLTLTLNLKVNIIYAVKEDIETK